MKKIFIILLTICLLAQMSYAQIPTNGLVGYWPFNGNANDESGHSYDGVVNGASLTTDRYGNANQAYNFSGYTSSYISIPDNPELHIKNNITISLWIFRTRTSSVEGVFCKGRDIGNNYSFMLNAAGGTNGVFRAGNTMITPKPVDINKWIHLVYVIDSAGSTQYLYVNGIKVNSSAAVLFDINNNYPIQIGRHIVNADGTGSGYAFKGKVDEILLYNRALSQSEIQDIYLLPCSSVDVSTGIAASYEFNGNAKDTSGNLNNGTVNGAILTTDRFGNANSAYSFNGLIDYIQVADNNSLDITTNLTISAWIYPTAINGDRKIVTKFPSDAYQLTLIDGQLSMLFKNGSAWEECRSSNTLAINKWYMVTGVYDYTDSKINIFVNDSFDNSLYATGLIPSTTAPLVIGNLYNGSQFFQGKIDDIRIYNRALTKCDIDSLFKMPNPKATIAEFAANPKTGMVPVDISFTDQSTNQPTNWLWSISPSIGVSFINSTNDQSQNPQCRFTQSGQYSVSLIVSNSSSSDTLTKNNYIKLDPNGIIEQNEIPEICIYPNPGNGSLNISLTSEGIQNVRILVTNNLGKIVYHESKKNDVQGIYNKQLDLTLLPNGIYMLTVKIGSKTVNEKISILK